MFVFKIPERDVKLFMQKLLREETFWGFEVRGIELAVLTKFEISGILDREFLMEEQADRNFCTWKELQPYLYFMIKGTRRPKLFKIIFSLPAAEVGSLHKNASAYFLNIVFENNEVLCTAASSEKSFAMDKTIDHVWEDYIKVFFNKNKISISTLD